MRQFIPSRFLSFQHAFSGLWHVFREERNAWIHAAATICAIIGSFWLKISRTEWALIILTISAVWATECINTAIEAAVDLISPDIHPLAKTAKDAGAAAVLTAAIASVVIGLIILAPPLIERLL